MIRPAPATCWSPSLSNSIGCNWRLTRSASRCAPSSWRRRAPFRPIARVVAEIGPRTALAAGEADLLADYLKSGGRLLMLIDPQFPLGAELQSACSTPLGLSSEPAIVIDPLNHFRTDPDKVAVPYYPAHPITARLALTVFAQARPIRLSQPPADGRGPSVLAASSQDSYLRPPSAAGGITVAAGEPARHRSRARRAGAVAVALDGVFPGAASDKHFRLVISGTSKFATNEYFSYVSDGELSVAIMRWLAEDDASPNLAPRTYSLPEIVLTSAQMRDTFIALEILLPLSTALFGCRDVVEAALTGAALARGGAMENAARPHRAAGASARADLFGTMAGLAQQAAPRQRASLPLRRTRLSASAFARAPTASPCGARRADGPSMAWMARRRPSLPRTSTRP